MLLSVVITGAPVSIKIVAVFLLAAGLVRLGLPRQAAVWLDQHKERITAAVDPGAAEVAQTPRVPLDELLTSRRSATGAWEPPARRDRDRRSSL
jgi:hypothetical protein